MLNVFLEEVSARRGNFMFLQEKWCISSFKGEEVFHFAVAGESLLNFLKPLKSGHKLSSTCILRLCFPFGKFWPFITHNTEMQDMLSTLLWQAPVRKATGAAINVIAWLAIFFQIPSWPWRFQIELVLQTRVGGHFPIGNLNLAISYKSENEGFLKGKNSLKIAC